MNEQDLMGMAAELNTVAELTLGKLTIRGCITVEPDRLYAYVNSPNGFVLGYGETARQAVDDAKAKLAERPRKVYTPAEVAATLGCETAP